MNAAQATQKYMRVLHIVFLLTVVLYLWVPWMLVGGQATESPFVVVLVLGMVALTSVAAVLFFQARRVRPAAEQLRLRPDDAQAAARWRTGLILCFAFSETIVLFGLALRLLGAPWKFSGVFYAVGALLLLACRPKLELLPE